MKFGRQASIASAAKMLYQKIYVKAKATFVESNSAREKQPPPAVFAQAAQAAIDALSHDKPSQEILRDIIVHSLDRLSDEQFVAIADIFRRTRDLDYAHQKISIGVRSQNELLVGLHYCRKEPETIAWIEAMPDGSVFYDIGANIGAFSLVAAAQHGRIKHIVSIEPAYHNFVALAQNIITNRLGELIIPLNCGIADKTMIGLFNYRKLMTGSAESVFGEPIDVKGAAFKPKAILQQAAFALDDLIRVLGLPFPTHIKVDVDGIETKIITGAKRTLTDPRIQGLMFEASSLDEEALICNTLSQYGFKLAQRQKKDLARAKTRNNYFDRV
ncbi:MAG: FkbM family methyltransferase [Deltaproteobacteria bacterium]|nr:FkbM family methyltransferase [Deltaproteobacteria bacterium]